mgnify:CR=1 FL=1
MKIGVSTASLYPLHAEDAFAELAALGIKTTEVFANSTGEAREPVTSQILDIRDGNGMEITSFHPFSSPMESVYLFSTYDRRIEEMMELYREFFGNMNRLGAKIFVLHGAILSSKCPEEHYFRQFRLLAEAGREYGVTVAQENVSYCMSGSLDFLLRMKRELGDCARFVLDLKQSRRSHADAFDYVRSLGGSIVHLHISDADSDRDCLPVGQGSFDFRRLMQELSAVGYDGAYIVELYRENYDQFTRLRESVDNLTETALSLGLI